MSERIYMSSPDVGEAEQQSVMDAMRSGWIAPVGPHIDRFEAAMAERVGAGYAVAVSSGTAALHLGLLGVGVRRGDVVITSTMTFAATANAIEYVGASPLFVDCDPSTGNMDPALLDEAIQMAQRGGQRVAAIMPVDLFGKCADYERILPIATAHGIPVVADAAESVGATRAGRAAGTFGEVSAFSFNGNKIMTTSGGGMILTDDEAVATRARYLATQARQPVVHYEHTDIGYNYRLSNLLAALGLAQLERLDSMIDRRREVRRRYAELFADVPGVSLFGAEDDDEDNCWLTSILIDPEVVDWTRDDLSAALAEDDIESRPLWKPMHLQPVFAGAASLTTGSAETLFERGLTLPSGSALKPDQVDRVLDRIATFIGSRT